MFKSICLIMFTTWVHAGGFQIDQINPNSGSTSGGFPVTIFISGQFNNQSLAQVVFGDKPCPIQSFTQIEIICTVPAGTGNSPVLIFSDSTQATGDGSNLFSYNHPVINSFTPNILNQLGGETLTLTGLDFGGSGSSVLIGGNRCTSVILGQNND